jgi:hypothetical protein
MKIQKSLLVCLILLIIPLLTLGQRINLSQTNGESFWPALAVNPDGVLMAIYTEAVEGSNDIYMTLSYDGGNSWTTPQRTYSRTQFIKSVALDADQYGNFHMCYADGWGSGGREVYYRYYVDGSWQAAEQLSFSSDNSNYCRVSADGDEVHVIWYQEIGFPIKPYVALKSKPIGGAWPVNTVDVSMDPSNGAVSCDVKAKDGNIYAVYRVQVYDGDTLLSKHISYSERLNGTWYGPTEIGETNLPDVDVDEYGNVHCIMTNGGLVEYRAKVNGVWQAREWLNDWGGIYSFFDIKYGFNNLIGAYMMSNGIGDHYSIYYSQKSYDGNWGSWGEPIELDPGTYAEFPKLAIDKNGTVHIIWADIGNGGEMDIFYTNLSLPGMAVPSIELDTASMVFECIEGTTASAQTFQVRNSGNATLNYSVETNQSWLSTTPESGSSDGEWDEITVLANASSLTDGEYTGKVSVTSAEASNSPQEITVTFKVGSDEPTIVLNKEALYFSHFKGNSNPSSQYFQIKNYGLGTMNYNFACEQGWVTILPPSGASSGEWDSISVTVDAESLSLGSHSTAVNITSPEADNSPQTVLISVVVNDEDNPPIIGLSKTSLNFGATSEITTPPQYFRIKNIGLGSMNWTLTENSTWMDCLPLSGTDEGKITVSVNTSGMVPGEYTGTISVISSEAANSPQNLAVNLKIYAPGSDNPPIGFFDTPANGLTVSGSVAVTGWALDDIEVTKVEIKRDPDPDDHPSAPGADGLIYIGDAVFVMESRPDVEGLYPDSPLNDRAGWGYMMLTYGLPRQGNGTFRLHAFAEDASGHRVLLGTKQFTSDNANRVQPFGTIDTPSPGATISGSYVNFGWALTPQPKIIPTDGSTIWISIDGVFIGQPNYNNFRQDIYDSFPGYANSEGAVGFYWLDTTGYANGVHNIGWYAVDNEGQADGFGSRFFEIQNTGGAAALINQFETLGYKDDESGRLEISIEGPQSLEAEQLERLKIVLKGEGGNRFIGWGTDKTKSLPVGSTLDRDTGVFYWSIGPGFLNRHVLHFAVTDGEYVSNPLEVIVSIVPKKFETLNEKKDRPIK